MINLLKKRGYSTSYAILSDFKATFWIPSFLTIITMSCLVDWLVAWSVDWLVGLLVG